MTSGWKWDSGIERKTVDSHQLSALVSSQLGSIVDVPLTAKTIVESRCVGVNWLTLKADS